MATYSDSWGIEVGADAVKAVRLQRSGDAVRVADWDVLPFKKILTTPDLNVDEAIQVNLDAFLAKHDIAKSNVVVSVPGNMAFARFAKLPPVEPKKIPDIVRFEAVQQIPFPIEQVEWDYQVFQQEDSPDVEVGIFAITKERVMNFLANFRRVNMRVDALTLSPLAVYNQHMFETAEDEDVPGTILLDIGTTSTDVIIVEDSGIWVRTLPIGGNNFTEALVKSFKLSFPKAEKLKREARTSKYARQIFQAMRPIFADLVQEIQRSIGYYQSIHRDSDLRRVVGYGSTFRLPGLQKFLKQQLQMDVIRPEGFKRIQVEGSRSAEFADNAINLATAYGLALQGLGHEKVSANIMPQAIVHQRLWRAKQPWFAAAAAVVAVAAGIALGRVYLDQGAYRSSLEQVEREVQSTLAAANSEAQKYNELAKDNPAQQIEDINRLLDYRDLWPKVLEDISQAVRESAGNREDLFQADYDALNFTQRTSWPRIYIDTIEAVYMPSGIPATTPGASGQPQAGAYGDEYGYGMGMGMGMGTTGSADATQAQLWSQATTADQFFDPAAKKAPVFQVTVTGTSPLPNADVANLLNDRLIRYLRQQNKRADRPYELVIDANFIASMGTLASSPTGRDGSRSAARRGGYTAPRIAPRGGGYGAGAGYGYEEEAGYGMDPYAEEAYGADPYGGGFDPTGRRGGTARPGDAQSLIPLRPGTELINPLTESQFTLQWYVQLKAPQQARKAAESTGGNGRPQPVAPEQQPEEAPAPNPQEQADVRPGSRETAGQEAQS